LGASSTVQQADSQIDFERNVSKARSIESLKANPQGEAGFLVVEYLRSLVLPCAGDHI
jgi:hypothetical protein